MNASLAKMSAAATIDEAVHSVQPSTSPNHDARKDDLTLALSKLQVLQRQEEGDHDACTSPSTSTLPTTATRSSAKSSQSPPSDGVPAGSAQLKAMDGSSVSLPPTSTSQGGTQSPASAPPLDVALVEALRNPRDRIFVLQYEREMSSKIKDAKDGEGRAASSWELPLMNTYQRMLVHRIADQFALSHSVDANTMQVTLSLRDESHIPDEDLATRAARERLCEPAAASFLQSASGASPSTGGNDAAVPSQSAAAPMSFSIMRREKGGARRAASQGESARDDNTDDAGSSRGANRRKDRRELTMEEREASYREARQRIFGVADDRASSSSGAVTPGSTSSATQSSVSKEPESGRASPSTASRSSSRPSLSPNLSTSALSTPPHLNYPPAAGPSQQQAAYQHPQHRHSVPYLAQPYQQHPLAWQGQGALHPINAPRTFVPMQPYGYGVYTPPLAAEMGYPVYYGAQSPLEYAPQSQAMYAPSTGASTYAAPAVPYGGPKGLYPSAAPLNPLAGLDSASATGSAGRGRRYPSDRTLFDPSKPLSSQHSNASRSPSSTSMMTATSSAPPLSRRTSNASVVSASQASVAADATTATTSSSASSSAPRRSQGSQSSGVDRSATSSPAASLKASLPQPPASYASISPAGQTSSLPRIPPSSLPARPDWVMAARRGQAAAAANSLAPAPGSALPHASGPTRPAPKEDKAA